MCDFKNLFEMSARQHRGHLCPRQVLGVRMGAYASELFDLTLPQSDKRLYTFVETDGCLIDGISSATNCTVGHRTMYVIDYGKTAATFVDTETNRAVRIWPCVESRQLALRYALDAPDRWHAQLEAYQVMPTNELLVAQQVTLTISPKALLSRHGMRVVCEECGEDIINEREVRLEGRILCRACALGAYYIPVEIPKPATERMIPAGLVGF
jgi:formylmethanofuran dehydrogenase subunit E